MQGRRTAPVLVIGAVLLALPAMIAARSATDTPTGVEAARQGNMTALRAAVRTRADANAAGVDGTTALHWAVQQGDVEMVNLLIGRGANVNAANRYGVTPLRLASIQGDAAVAEALLKAGADANATRAESGETAMMIAARSGHVEIVRALLAHGAKIDVAEPLRKQTALMWAAAEGHPAVVKTLVEAGANTRLLSLTNMSALMFAIRAGDLESTRVFLDAGADVNAPAADGTRMLVLAIVNAHFDVAAFLLERGADANVDDPHGKPLHVLAFMRRSDGGGLTKIAPRQLPQTGVDSVAFAKLLLAHGADINARYGMSPGTGNNGQAPKHVALGSYHVPFDGATPFYIATITADVPFMRFLAANGADVNIPTTANITPLLGASGVGFYEGESAGTNDEAFEAVKLAYELGNDPKAIVQPSGKRIDPTWIRATAMHGAANRGSNEMVQWLADKGVPLDTKSEKGVSPYHIAAGLDSGQFHAMPETAAFIVKFAKERGITIDTTEPKLDRSKMGF